MNLFFVFLRRPTSARDKRSDPFWEFGSFGRTGCHKGNILHPTSSLLENGDQLAFLQGGDGEIRIVGLSPPIHVKASTSRVEATWTSNYRPMPYVDAPLLINNKKQSNFPLFIEFLRERKRLTLCGAAASRLRSRKQPIENALATQILDWFSVPGRSKAETYLDAIQGPHTSWNRNGVQKEWASNKCRMIDFGLLSLTRRNCNSLKDLSETQPC